MNFTRNVLNLGNPLCGRNVRRRGREINECHCKTKENQSWGMLPGNQRRVTSTQKLEWLM
jgi:hypothetical protein